MLTTGRWAEPAEGNAGSRPRAKDQRAADAGWDMNGEYNGLELPSGHAYAGHPAYNEAVSRLLNSAYDPSMTPVQAYHALTDIIDALYPIIEALGTPLP